MTNHFGENLAYLRKINKLEQKDIAKLVNKSVATVSFWEKGRPFIFVNRNNNYFRLRMSVAHELCHLFFHGAEDVEKDIKRIEEEAKAFAGAFLLPNPGFIEDIKYINLQNLYCSLHNFVGQLLRQLIVITQAHGVA